ncbi:condensation domain-containing protein [Kitasatospora griseola]|uniref:condensation domain-containing protein n=1 Tax=Kitasatospora griseola TaxID=2064 RepID=UPI00342AFCBC
MTAVETLARLEELRVELRLTEDGRLAYRAPKGLLGPGDIEAMKRHRDGIKELLDDQAAGLTNYPLTAAQMRLWLVDRRHGTSPGYNIGGAFRLRGPLDTGRFCDAMQKVVDRQPLLRSSVALREGLPVLQVHRSLRLDLPLLDVPAATSPSLLKQLVGEQLGLPFDLGHAPLFRAALLRMSDTDHVAVLVAHHIISDDHSIGVIGRQALEYYGQHPSRANGVVAAVGPAVRPSSDTPERTAQLRAMRRRVLESVPDQELPRPAALEEAGSAWAAESYRIQVDSEGTSAWQDRRRSCRATTLGMATALSALAIAAADGPHDLIVGVPDLGRDRAEDWDVVGCFTATMVLRAEIRGTDSFAGFVRGLMAEAAEAQAAKHVPYEELVGRKAHAQSGGTVLWVAPYPEPDFPQVDGLEIEAVEATADVARHDLRVAVFTREDRMELQVTRRTAAVDREFAQRVTAGLTRLHQRVPAPEDSLRTIIDDIRRDRSVAAEGDAHDEGAALLASVRAARRSRTVTAAPKRMVDVREPHAGRWAPAEVVARVPGVDLPDWTGRNLDTVRDLLRRQGAVLMRGFACDRAGFSASLEAVAGSPLVDYVNRSTPRTRVDGNVFTSTEYPATEAIPMHSEQSYTTSWPLWLGFMCERAPATGGATPLASTAEVLRALPEDLVRRFAEREVSYERWYHPNLDLPWSEVFQTDSPEEVDRLCLAAGIEARWYEAGVLRTRQKAQAILRHPESGERVWFNQANLFHAASLPAAVLQGLRDAYGERLPRHAVFGDGSPIEEADLRRVQAAWDGAQQASDWQDGDVVIVDNISVAHGRQPYTGARTVLVAMAGTGSAETGKGSEGA